mgnify:CR=1 FL=1
MLIIYLILWFTFSSAIFLTNDETTTYYQIYDIEFTGLKKTDGDYLMRFLQCQKGSTVLLEQIEIDVQCLRNLPFFAQVNYELKTVKKKRILVFNCTEKWTLLPIFTANLSAVNTSFSVGLSDINALGRGMYFKAVYHYYDLHSFELNFFNPYIKGSKLGWRTELAKISRIEPIYWNSMSRLYRADKAKLFLEVQYEVNFRQTISLGTSYLYERYEGLGETNMSTTTAPIPEKAQFHKQLLKISYTLDRRNYSHIYLSGFANQFNAETTYTLEEKWWFYKITNEFMYFHRLKKTANIATKFTLGVSTNNNTPLPAFVQDNYLNIRGIGNRVQRGSAEAVINIEYRQTLFDIGWLAAQGVAFSDYGLIRLTEQSINEVLKKPQQAWYGGAGLRLNFTRFSKAIVRIDYGYDLQHQKPGGLIFAVDHFF